MAPKKPRETTGNKVASDKVAVVTEENDGGKKNRGTGSAATEDNGKPAVPKTVFVLLLILLHRQLRRR
jgi:hypothetical protein